jgi:DNA invertase Pin-like site-specific DNA recombinase
MTQNFVPAAQYLRMSTDHQQYSIQNQSAAIQRWADEHRFTIVQTYEDAGKSGLVLNRREGLRQLLQDVVSREISYRAILVLDVSRWGRFQDIDEAAHYEFLCRSAGIPVHYCAESFANDASLPSMIMKALKRMMAGEYSRELSAKVYAGASRLAQLGFKQGGIAGHGYRRTLVSASRERKLILLPGQRKSIQEDRVILVPGPAEEVNCIREIFRLFVDDHKMPKAIAAELNGRGYKYEGVLRHQWYPQAVNRILRNAKYTGNCIYGRCSGKLHTPKISLPPSMWIVKESAWQPLIDQQTFNVAQQRLLEQTRYRTDDDLLVALKKLWSRRGTLSEALVNEAEYLPSLAPFRARFGSLSEACARIGFHTGRTEAVLARRKTLALRRDLVHKIVSNATAKITLLQHDGHFRPRLRMPDHTLVSIEVLRCFRSKKGDLRWAFNAHHHERDFVTLIARLNECNDGFHDFYILPDLKRRTRCTIKDCGDKLLADGQQLVSLVDFVQVVKSVRGRRTAAA